MSKNVKVLGICGGSPNPCNIVFVVPDTNMWFNKRKQLFNVLECYKECAVIALPHVMIDEGVPETYKCAILRKVDVEIANRQFRRKLLTSVLDAMTRGFLLTAAYTPGVYGASRYGFAYYVGKYDKVILNSTLCEYISKSKCRNRERCYFSALKQVIDLIHKLQRAWEISELRKIKDEFKEGACKYEYLKTALNYALQEISNKHSMTGNGKIRQLLEQLRNNIKTLLGILADILIIASCFALARERRKPVVCVSDDQLLLQTLNNVRNKLRATNVYSCRLEELAQTLDKLTQATQ